MVRAVNFSSDRLRAAIETVVRGMMPSHVYAGQWPAVVTGWDAVRQRAELTTPAGSPLPSVMRSVPVVVDPPGTKLELELGTPVLVAFQGGSPWAPYFRPAAYWGDSGLPAPLVALAGDGPAVARVGDPVGGSELAFFTFPGVPIPVLHVKTDAAWIPVPVYPAPPIQPPSPTQPGTPTAGTISSGSSLVTCG